MLVIHLAVADILTLLLMCFPTLLTAATRRWILGYFLCLTLASLKFVPFFMQQAIITAMTLNRAFVLKYPLKSLGLSKTRMVAIKAFTWGTWTFLAICGSFGIVRKSEFSPEWLDCMAMSFAEQIKPNKPPKSIIIGLFLYIPLFLILSSNIFILCLRVQMSCKKDYSLNHHSKSYSSKTVKMVLLVSTVYLVSMLPISVQSVVNTVPNWCPILTKEVALLNSVANPLLYKNIGCSDDKRRKMNTGRRRIAGTIPIITITEASKDHIIFVSEV